MADEYKVLLDPALGISAADLADAWAGIPECVEAGQLDPDDQPQQFGLDPASVAFGAVIAATAGLAKDLILLLVKRAVERADQAQEKRTAEEVEVTTTPDPKTGLPIIRVSKRGDT